MENHQFEYWKKRSGIIFRIKHLLEQAHDPQLLCQ